MKFLLVMSVLTCIRWVDCENVINYSLECYKCIECSNVNQKITGRCFTMHGCYIIKASWNYRSARKTKVIQMGCITSEDDFCPERNKQNEECEVCYTDLCNGENFEVSDLRMNVSQSEADDFDRQYLTRPGKSSDSKHNIAVRKDLNRMLLVCVLYLLVI